MNDLIALTIIRRADAEVLSARPHSPVVDDGRTRLAPAPVGPVRRALAVVLRRAAAAERRWADRMDPVRGPATPVGC